VSVSDELGWSPLLWAAKSGNHEIVGLLIAAKAELGSVDPQGNTALHKSAQMGSVRCVGMLLEAGADTAHCNFHRQTPLDVATLFDQQDCVQRLSDAGAKTADCHVQTVREGQKANGEDCDGIAMPDLKSSRVRKEEMDKIAQMGAELNKIQDFVNAAKAEKQNEDEKDAEEGVDSEAEVDETNESKESEGASNDGEELTCDFALDFEKRLAQIRANASTLPTREELAQKHRQGKEQKFKAIEDKRKAAEQEQKEQENVEEEPAEEETGVQTSDSSTEDMMRELQEARSQIRRLQQSRISREELMRAVKNSEMVEVGAAEDTVAASQQPEPM
jgi:hypothetical protein